MDGVANNKLLGEDKVSAQSNKIKRRGGQGEESSRIGVT